MPISVSVLNVYNTCVAGDNVVDTVPSDESLYHLNKQFRKCDVPSTNLCLCYAPNLDKDSCMAEHKLLRRLLKGRFHERRAHTVLFFVDARRVTENDHEEMEHIKISFQKVRILL